MNKDQPPQPLKTAKSKQRLMRRSQKVFICLLTIIEYRAHEAFVEDAQAMPYRTSIKGGYNQVTFYDQFRTPVVLRAVRRSMREKYENVDKLVDRAIKLLKKLPEHPRITKPISAYISTYHRISIYPMALTSLYGYLKSRKIKLTLCLTFCQQLIEGVEFLHRHNSAHFDIKIDNILIYRKKNNYFSKLTDFELSQTFNEKNELITHCDPQHYKMWPPELSDKTISKIYLDKKGKYFKGPATPVDIYMLGEVFKTLYYQLKKINNNEEKNIKHELQKLYKTMIFKNPYNRPSIKTIKKNKLFQHLNLTASKPCAPKTPHLFQSCFYKKKVSLPQKNAPILKKAYALHATLKLVESLTSMDFVYGTLICKIAAIAESLFSNLKPWLELEEENVRLCERLFNTLKKPESQTILRPKQGN